MTRSILRCFRQPSFGPKLEVWLYCFERDWFLSVHQYSFPHIIRSLWRLQLFSLIRWFCVFPVISVLILVCMLRSLSFLKDLSSVQTLYRILGVRYFFLCHVFSPNMPMVQMVRKFWFGIWLQHIIPVVEKVSGRPFCAILPNASEQDRSYYKLYAFILQLSLLYCGNCNNYICSYFCNFGNCHYEASLLICSII